MKILDTIGPKLLFILGLSTTLFMLLPVLTYEGLEYIGYEVILGKELININPFNLGTLAETRLPFSIFALGAFLLPLVAGISALMNKRLVITSFALFIVSIFLLITLPNTTHIIYTFAGIEDTANIDFTMAPGLIGAIVMSAFATLIALLMMTDPKTPSPF